MTSGTPNSEPPTEPVDWDALARYLAGESTPSEADDVRRWLAADPARAELLTALDRTLGRLALDAPTDLDVEGALRRVSARLDEPEAMDVGRAPTTSRPFRDRVARRHTPQTPRWRGAGFRAAVLGGLAAAGALLWYAGRQGGDQSSQPASARTFATRVGARDSVRLPDGSLVLLGPASEIVVDAGFGAARRDVTLRGEGYFDVRHDAARPFTVRAGVATIRDVGTSFTVASDSAAVRVAVTNGAVELRAAAAPDAPSVVLREGDRGVVDAGGRAVAERGVVTQDDLAWTRGRLTFRDAPLAHVGAELRRWYGIELRVADSSIAGRHFTATFDANDPPSRVLDVLALALGADVERRGDTAVVRGARAGARQ